MDLKTSFRLATYRGKIPMKGSSKSSLPIKVKGNAGKGSTKANVKSYGFGVAKDTSKLKSKVYKYHANKGSM